MGGQNFQYISKAQVKSQAILAGVVTLFFPLAFWIIELTQWKANISLQNIIFIHSKSPALWFIDVLPLFVFIGTYALLNQKRKVNNSLMQTVQQMKEQMDINAQFAKAIGEGNYYSEFKVVSPDDILGNSLLIMRNNLLKNYQKEAEQNWIAEGKDQISNILRLHNKIEELAYEVIVKLIQYINAIQGAFYIYDDEKDKIINVATYAYNRRKYLKQEFSIGEGLIGECAFEMDIIYRTEIPDDYVTITSGILGDKKPKSLLIVPLISDEKLQGILEFASLQDEIPELTITFMRELGEIIARTIFNLKVTERTERLLRESQKMTEELQENEEQLRQNAEEMRATQEELRRSNEQLEKQIQEVENAQKRINSLLENSSEIIMIYDEYLNLIYQSPSVKKILGYSPEEMDHGKYFDRLTRKGEMEVRNMFKRLFENPLEVITIQYTYMKKDGQKIFLETTGRNLLHDPAIRGILLNSQDITERKRAEKEERMRSKMQSLSENSLDLILRVSLQGHFFYANPVVEDYFGVDPRNIINKTIDELTMPEEMRTYFKNTIKQIKAKPEKLNHEIKITIQLGEKLLERIMSIDAIPEYNENELETILFVGHDITEAKRIELEIQEKNKKIEDSINYAQRIQSSILPDNKLIREYFPKSFIFYKPRDVVSGDFPWFFHHGDDIYIAAVDCTGHGVPGAMLSFIGYFLLNNIVDNDKALNAGEICDLLHYGVRTTLKQDREDASGRDGMDIALCKINIKKHELHYAGAHRSLYLLRKGELSEFKGDRKSIGGIPIGKKAEEPFTNHTINIISGDRIFFFSDGLPDQLGGPENKKYSPARIRQIILDNANNTMSACYEVFVQDFEEWKGNRKQIDDVLLIGIEF
ncbi:MAG: PAS domain S-box protein [Bacteroidales bacterium]|nr:PAS domain S-box protein [Bacteroidales bacterium]HPO65168.1 PAS domain S-box protein [Bacteroidales bacterium]